MEYILVITCFVLVAFVATGAIVYSLHKQRDAAIQEVATISQRLTAIEKKLDENENAGRQEDEKTLVSTERPGIQGDEKTLVSTERLGIQGDLSGMTDEELFQYITRFIREQEMYRWPDFNRAAVMQHFSL